MRSSGERLVPVIESETEGSPVPRPPRRNAGSAVGGSHRRLIGEEEIGPPQAEQAASPGRDVHSPHHHEFPRQEPGSREAPAGQRPPLRGRGHHGPGGPRGGPPPPPPLTTAPPGAGGAPPPHQGRGRSHPQGPRLGAVP